MLFFKEITIARINAGITKNLQFSSIDGFSKNHNNEKDKEKEEC